MLSLLFLVVYWALFISLGLWLALKALERRWLPKEFLYIGTLAASLTIYYGIFYLYLISPRFAGIVVKLVMLLSLGALISLLNRFRRASKVFTLVRNFFLLPLLFTAVFMFIYSTIFFSCVSRPPALAGSGELDGRTFCHTETLPFDNSLDFIFGQNVLKNQDNRTAATWSMVDRPPLQIAATLPLLDHEQGHSQFAAYYVYYLFAIFLQLSWVSAFWGIFQILKFSKRFQVLTFVALGSIGFFYINSVFVWPKLLAASFVFTAVLVLLAEIKTGKYRYVPFCSLLISLGLLSHDGVIFTVVPFALYYLYKIIRLKKVNWRYLSAAAAIALVLLVPWFAYKSSVVQSDRLTKWQLAGITSADDKRGTLQAISDQYKTLSFSQWTRNKADNVATIFTGNYARIPGCSYNPRGLINNGPVNKCLFQEWRNLTFFSTFFAFELLGFGWLAVVYAAAKRRLDGLDKELLLLIAASLIFWVLLVFMPHATIVHTGSYATMMLIALLLVKKLSELPNYFIGTIAGLQVVVFYLSWIALYFKIGG